MQYFPPPAETVIPKLINWHVANLFEYSNLLKLYFILFRGARHGHKMSAKQKRLEMQEKDLMAKMQKTYKLEPKYMDENTTAVKTKTLAKSEETKITPNDKKSKKKKQKNSEKYKDKKIKVNSVLPNNFIEVSVSADHTDGKENVDSKQGKEIKKQAKKKRKAKDSDNYDSICDKKVSKEM